MRIRDATADDAPALAAIVSRCDAAYRDWAPPGWEPPGSFADDLPRIAARIGDPDAHTVVAEADEATGFADWRSIDDDPGVAELRSLYVDPRRWGRGQGRALLRAAQAEMSTAGFERSRLWVPDGDGRAVALYESEGWSGTGAMRWHDRLRLDLLGYELSLG